jgi:voltage-gated potassium channel
MNGHYIICGLGRIGSGIARELDATGHAWVAIDPAQAVTDNPQQGRAGASQDGQRVLADDATDDQLLLSAGM